MIRKMMAYLSTSFEGSVLNQEQEAEKRNFLRFFAFGNTTAPEEIDEL
jgi:hypothetical protein